MYRQGIPETRSQVVASVPVDAPADSRHDNRDEVREFLISRRAKITPADAGLPLHRERRVPGLRRTEVAALAGVSVEYYAKLGSATGRAPAVELLDSTDTVLEHRVVDTATEAGRMFRTARPSSLDFKDRPAMRIGQGR